MKKNMKINEQTGLNIALFGGLGFILGGIIAFLNYYQLGMNILKISLIFSLLGTVIHFNRNWKKIFHINQKH